MHTKSNFTFTLIKVEATAPTPHFYFVFGINLEDAEPSHIDLVPSVLITNVLLGMWPAATLLSVCVHVCVSVRVGARL